MPSPPLREAPGVLGRIAARSLADVERREASAPRPEVLPRPEQRRFVAGLRAPGLSLIAEFKPRAPSGGELCERGRIEPWIQRAAPHARAVSVLCDAPFFGGGFDLLDRARASTTLPLLCKDFVVHERQLFEAAAAGADAVLLIVALLPPPTLRRLRARAGELGLETLVEVHDRAELDEALDDGAPIIGVNSRDLRTLRTDLAGAADLLACIPEDRVRVAESGLTSAADVERVRGVCDAVLIGTALSRAEDPAAVVRALGLSGRGSS